MLTEQYFKVRGIAYATNTYVSERETILFIHGSTGSSSAWEKITPGFGEEYNLIVPDLRGHGYSKDPRSHRAYTTDLFAEDLQALLDELGVKECIVVGHSFGALVAMTLYHRIPSRVKKLVLLSPSDNVRTHIVAKIGRILLFPLLFLDRIPLQEAKKRRVDYARFPNTYDWDIRRMIADIYTTGIRTAIYTTYEIFGYERSRETSKINLPTLVLHGERDTYFPLHDGETVAKRIPDAEFVILEGADHILVLSHAPRVIKEVGDFLKK